MKLHLDNMNKKSDLKVFSGLEWKHAGRWESHWILRKIILAKPVKPAVYVNNPKSKMEERDHRTNFFLFSRVLNFDEINSMKAIRFIKDR